MVIVIPQPPVPGKVTARPSATKYSDSLSHYALWVISACNVGVQPFADEHWAPGDVRHLLDRRLCRRRATRVFEDGLGRQWYYCGSCLPPVFRRHCSCHTAWRATDPSPQAARVAARAPPTRTTSRIAACLHGETNGAAPSARPSRPGDHQLHLPPAALQPGLLLFAQTCGGSSHTRHRGECLISIPISTPYPHANL